MFTRTCKTATMVATLGTLLGITPAAAQLCQGLASFQGKPIQAFGNGDFKNGSRASIRGLSLGGARGFWSIEGGTTYIDAFNGSASEFGLGVGYQVPLNQKGTAQLCPTANVAYLSGPNNIDGNGTDYSESHRSLGVTAGVVAARAAHLDIVPTALVALANSQEHLVDASGSATSTSQYFGMVGLGVGFVFSQRMSVRPAVVVPFGSVAPSSLSVDLVLAVNFGVH